MNAIGHAIPFGPGLMRQSPFIFNPLLLKHQRQNPPFPGRRGNKLES